MGAAFLLTFVVTCKGEALQEVDLALDKAWTLSIDGGPPREFAVSGCVKDLTATANVVRDSSCWRLNSEFSRSLDVG